VIRALDAWCHFCAFEVPPLRLHAIYPKGRAQVRRIKMLLDALAAGFAGEGLRKADG
jgi:hypothetical protein